MNKNILALMPVFVFMIIMLIVSIYGDDHRCNLQFGKFLCRRTGTGMEHWIRMDLYVRRSGDSVIVGAWYPW